MQRTFIILISLLIVLTVSSCRDRRSDGVTVALPEKFSSFDTLTSMSAPDASAERIKNLIFNALVKKNENFEYVGELAKEIETSEDGMTITFRLVDNVKFHNGREFTSADVKYTFDELFRTDGKGASFKSGAFFDTVPIDSSETGNTATPQNANAAAKPAEETKTKRVAHIVSIETPDPKTVVFTVATPALRHQLLSNLVAIPVIPEGSVAQLKDQPIGSGPFKFVNFDSSQNVVELTAFDEYWEGAPKVSKLRVKTVPDANSLQAELQTGSVDIAPNPSNLPPDMLKALNTNSDLQMEQFEGSNIQYLVFNAQSPPLNNKKVRQAIGFSIDREKIVTELFSGQASLASSILPTRSWAFSPGTAYSYDPEKAKQLLREAGYKNEPIIFKYSAGNAATNQYAQVIQSSLNDVGLNVRIETLESNVIRQQLAQGQFQMFTGVWIGGNQDPIFLRDLFSSSKIPGGSVSCCNRSRYTNAEVDWIVEDAINAIDRERSRELYIRSWELISDDLPLYPLWYPANIVIANKRIGNIKMAGSGDWSFLKDITVEE